MVAKLDAKTQQNVFFKNIKLYGLPAAYPRKTENCSHSTMLVEFAPQVQDGISSENIGSNAAK